LTQLIVCHTSICSEQKRIAKKLKEQLQQIAVAAGLLTRTHAPHNFRVINRIAIEELEAWFFGDVVYQNQIKHTVFIFW
jgi:hypothetical protein